MIEISDETAGDLFAFRISGKILQSEAHKVANMVEARIEAHGYVRCLAEITDLTGAEFGALEEELEFDLHHAKEIKRCAIVGDREWERWLVKVVGPFFRNADVRFFEAGERAAALDWVREG